MPTDLPPRRPRKEPVFQYPPQWIHESVAVLLAPRRELKKLAVLRIVNRALQPGRALGQEEATPPSAPSPADRRSQS